MSEELPRNRASGAKADIIKRYSNGEITVVWEPSLCVHSGICARGLPKVFDPRRRPWVILDGFDTETIRHQVERCPSGALSIDTTTPETDAE
jgi:uncharacterized Fe-S cluster protein YjdI